MNKLTVRLEMSVDVNIGGIYCTQRNAHTYYYKVTGVGYMEPSPHGRDKDSKYVLFQPALKVGGNFLVRPGVITKIRKLKTFLSTYMTYGELLRLKAETKQAREQKLEQEKRDKKILRTAAKIRKEQKRRYEF